MPAKVKVTGINLNIDDSYPYINIYNTRYYIVSLNYDEIKYSPIDNDEIDSCKIVNLDIIKHLNLNRETLYALRSKNMNYIINHAKNL
mgnify:CR=1 FL=1